jgi:hypothetical protein
MQQAHGPSRGESRRGGAKPRGRNGSWTGGAVGPKAEPGQPGSAGSGRAEDVSVEGQQGHEPQERMGPDRGRSFGSGPTARDPANVRTLRRRRKIWSADDGWLATRKRAPGDVLEGPGLVTAEGRGGQQQRTIRAAHRGRRGFIRAARRNSRRSRRRHRSAPLRRPRKTT